jgi:hypothetical protein
MKKTPRVDIYLWDVDLRRPNGTAAGTIGATSPTDAVERVMRWLKVSTMRIRRITVERVIER